jgi:hypothetical protein
MNLFSDRSAADNLPPFKYQRFQSGLRKIAGCDQTVMATPNDDNVVRCHPRH